MLELGARTEALALGVHGGPRGSTGVHGPCVEAEMLQLGARTDSIVGVHGGPRGSTGVHGPCFEVEMLERERRL